MYSQAGWQMEVPESIKSQIMIKVTEEEYVEHTDSDDGICLACEEWTFGGVEPDAEEYTCESCNQAQVYGAEQALIIGKLDII